MMSPTRSARICAGAVLDETVIGDGTFLMNPTELVTAARTLLDGQPSALPEAASPLPTSAG